MKKIFIIGGGIAALEAAKSARSTQRDALIVLISAENALPYSRPMLTKQLMGKVTAHDLAVESAAWYDEKDIVVLTGRTVTAIDPVGKTLVAGGTPFHWDSLILATGASCFVPPIPGADGANVVAVRTFGDVARVREIAKTAKNAAVIGGGLGVAIAYPHAKALHEAGCEVDLIVGFRNEHLIILKDELAAACTDLTIMTDDGSNGNKGFVTQALQAKLDAGKAYDEVIAIGPLPMMKAVCDLTKPKDIKTIVSMNPIMIDGTGMCGGCRVTVGGVTKFACVDGPDFDGHQVDWAEAISRSRMFRPEEQRAMEKLHKCRLTGGVR